MTTTRILLYFIAFISCTALCEVTSPPKIVKQPTQEEILFQVAQPGEVDKPFIIECEAEGEPAPKYRWVRNGKPIQFTINDKRITQESGRGTLVVRRPRDEDLGQYQCFAYNEWGTAASNSVFVRRAELNSFKETDSQQVVKAEEGKPFKLTCEPPHGHPKPKVYWIMQGNQGEIKPIDNSRMTLDPEGNLWFSNVTHDDASVDFAYVCTVNSIFRKEYKFGNKIFLEVTQTGIAPTLNKHELVHQYTTRTVKKALKGKTVELYCIYGGTPLPEVIWNKNGQRILGYPNIFQENYGKSLKIRDPTYGDKGNYTCEISNGVGTDQSHSIQLIIEAAPFFTVEPEIQNLEEGESAEIKCEAGGTPVPKITWIHNGKPIEQAEPNPRRQVSANKITITNLVNKDTGNYGCNATNSFGYVYKDVYINVPDTKEGHMKSTNYINYIIWTILLIAGAALILLIILKIETLKRYWFKYCTRQLPTTLADATPVEERKDSLSPGTTM